MSFNVRKMNVFKLVCTNVYINKKGFNLIMYKKEYFVIYIQMCINLKKMFSNLIYMICTK